LEPYWGYNRIQGGYGRILGGYNRMQKKTGFKFVTQMSHTLEPHQGYDREKNKIEWKYVNRKLEPHGDMAGNRRKVKRSM
jgi:hypothetical protein